MRKIAAFCVLSLLSGSALAMSGCAHTENVEEKQINTMRDQLNKDEAELDEHMAPFNGAKSNDEVPPPNPKGRPAKTEQDVIALSPGQNAENGDPALDGEDPDDTTPRPTIHVAGGGMAPQMRNARGLNERGAARARGAQGDQIDTNIPDEEPNGGATGPAIQTGGGDARPSALDPAAKIAYDNARSLVVAKKYRDALDQLAAFLVKYPDHPMASNAMYWRGECFYALGDFGHAESELEGTIARFPLGNKAPDALLKLGMTEERLGHADKARAAYDKLRTDFSKSDAARHIPQSSPSASPKGPKEIQ